MPDLHRDADAPARPWVDDLEAPAMLQRRHASCAPRLPRRDRSSAMNDAGSVPRLRPESPQGAMISEWPKVSRLFSCRPPCAAANTKQPFSMARARSSTVPMRLAGLAREGRGHGEERGAGFGQAAVERGEAQVVADRQPERPQGRSATTPSRPAGSCATRDSSRRRQIDVEHVDLVVAGEQFAVGIDQERAVDGLLRRSADAPASRYGDGSSARAPARARLSARRRLLRREMREQRLAVELHHVGHLRRLHVIGAAGRLADQRMPLLEIGLRINSPMRICTRRR